MTKTFKSIFSITTFLVVLFLVSCGDNKSHKSLTVDEQYPKPWREPNNEEFVSIGKTLVKNNVTGCGEYYLRSSSQSKGSYLVGCSSDGTNWTYYMVWVYAEKVMGPYTDTTVEKPR
mgnify:CR=1 FL=1